MRTAATAPDAFTLDRVTVRRGSAVLLDAVTCSIRAGTCTAVVGPSGAGKSTLLRLLNRLEEPAAGTVRFRGRPLTRLDAPALRRKVALVGQQPVLLADYVLDELRTGRPELDAAQAARLLARVGLPADMLHRATAGLSGGQAQRVCLARALAVAPEALLLDEPTSALDRASAETVEDAVRALVADGTTVVLVSHDTARVRWLAARVLVLDGGRLTDRTPPLGERA